ncbi:hypothetical protein ACLOJK_038869 [Asimina triloba]
MGAHGCVLQNLARNVKVATVVTVDQLEETRKATEKERDFKHMEAVKVLNAVKSEIEAKLQDLEQRERRVEAMVVEGDLINSTIGSTRESGAATRQQLADKCQEIVSEWESELLVESIMPFKTRDSWSESLENVIGMKKLGPRALMNAWAASARDPRMASESIPRIRQISMYM